jgi:hypothetical protein
MMMEAIPNGEWFVTKIKDRFAHEHYGLIRHSEDATAYIMAFSPDTETQLEAKINKGGNNAIS